MLDIFGGEQEQEMVEMGSGKPKTPSTGDNLSKQNNVSFESNAANVNTSFNLFGEPHVHQSSLVETQDIQ